MPQVSNYKDKVFGGIPFPITNTTQQTGPFFALTASANGCTVTTTGLTNNLSAFPVAAGGTLYFGRELAATLTLNPGECIAYKVT